ncbi:1-acyl-sn-glycerol-3-phosphate acyltransferase [Erysipelothrix aquatica]
MLVTFIALPYYWIRSQWLRRYGSDDQIDRELKMYSRHYFGIRGKTITPVNRPVDPGTCIYLSNHQSHNDIFVTLGIVETPFRFVAKKELFTSFITGSFMKMSRSYPLDREDPRQSLTLLKQALEDTTEGHSLLAFPEGTRSHQKEMVEFKAGMFSVLRKSTVPIVPMYIKNSYKKNTRNYEVFFGEPMLPETFNKLKGTELSLEVKRRMEMLMHQAYQ